MKDGEKVKIIKKTDEEMLNTRRKRKVKTGKDT